MGFAPRPAERRQFGRRRTHVHALISARGRPVVPCVMCDVSDGGALLQVANPQWLPQRFRLLVEAAGFEAECEIVRRSDTSVGVRFSTPTPFDE